jgi:hypothetical protein
MSSNELPVSLVAVSSAFVEAHKKLKEAKTASEIDAAAGHLGGRNGHLALAGQHAVRDELLAELAHWIVQRGKDQER